MFQVDPQLAISSATDVDDVITTRNAVCASHNLTLGMTCYIVSFKCAAVFCVDEFKWTSTAFFLWVQDKSWTKIMQYSSIRRQSVWLSRALSGCVSRADKSTGVYSVRILASLVMFMAQQSNRHGGRAESLTVFSKQKLGRSSAIIHLAVWVGQRGKKIPQKQ